jgi:hypothetical protein
MASRSSTSPVLFCETLVLGGLIWVTEQRGFEPTETSVEVSA